MNINNFPKTIFCDIDGVILQHDAYLGESECDDVSSLLLPCVYKKFKEWIKNGNMIILTTGRKESLRKQTIRQLEEEGIVYDMLIMGLPRGQRVVINDFKPNSDAATAIAINLPRNEGMKNV